MSVHQEDQERTPLLDNYRCLSPSYRQFIEEFLLESADGRQRKIDWWVRQLGDHQIMEVANEILEKNR